MKKVTLQLEDINGLVEKESELILGDNDTLVMQYPEHMSNEIASKWFKLIKYSIENGSEVIGMPNSLTLKVIRKHKLEG